MKRSMKKKWKVIVSTAILAAAFTGFASQTEAAQPHSSYWYPDSLLKWDPKQDKDADFNKGTVKLQKRTKGFNQVNPNALADPKVVALAAMNPSTSGTPSQGSDKFNIYAFNNWQYIDKLVMWGGSAGEGLIVPPSADVIDAAHKNGVPVLGTVFLPQTEHGGKIAWMRELIQKDEKGCFPVADKLLEAAAYYGFDGWFINQETQGATREDAAQMQEFLTYLQNKKPENMEILWYDSMIDTGQVAWQGALTNRNRMFFQNGGQQVADGMFIDFRWQYGATAFQQSPEAAKRLGRSPYDLFAGIDVEANGYNTKINCPVLFPKGKKATTSLGIYRPDWAFNSSKTFEEYMEKEQIFWAGAQKNPALAALPEGADPKGWSGIAHYINDQSAVTGTPFITHFNTGNGKLFAVDGEVVRDKEWNNRSLQDVLPSWRWIAESDGTALKPDFDWSKAYFGGSSLKVKGDLSPAHPTKVKLYKADLSVQDDTAISLVYQTNSDKSTIKVGVSFSDEPDTFTYLDLKPGKDKNGWKQGAVDLSPYAGKKVAALSLEFGSSGEIRDFQANIGELAIENRTEQPASLPAVSGLNIRETEFTEGIYGDGRLEWNKLSGDDVLYYQVYRVKPDHTREYIGATPNNVYYVPQMKRTGKEASTVLEVVPVNRSYRQGEKTSVKFDWPAYPKPTAKFSAEKTLIAPGESVTFRNESSEVTESVEWSFPGARPETSTEENPSVAFPNEGTYTVTLRAKNSEGEDVATKKEFITVTKEAAGGVGDLALNKQATASSFVNDREAPKFALDGNDKTKWCAVGDGPHWLTVDLGSTRKVSGFVVKHAEAGGEAAAFNTRDFEISVSLDGKNWTQVVDVKGNTLGTSKHSIALTEARYVKLNVTKPTQGGDTAARIYGFEVHGLKAPVPTFTDIQDHWAR